jgi:uroporphyrinogen-III synthase
VGRGVTAEAPVEGLATRPRVIVTRAVEQASGLANELDNAGLEPVLVPTIAVELEPPAGELDRCVRRLDGYRWIVSTSANGARAIVTAVARVASGPGRPRWAAIGPATRRVLEDEGIHVDFQPSESSATTLSEELPIRRHDRVLVVRGDLADEGLADALRARGAEVDDVVAYRTREAPESSRLLLRRALTEGPIAAVAFTSGSTVRGLVALGDAASVDVRSLPSICIGPETADEARSAGFRVLAVSPSPESAALAATSALALAAHPQETS